MCFEGTTFKEHHLPFWRGDFMSNNTNPRGEKRPRDGRGKGIGMKGGRRAGKNPNPCSPKRGYGKGKGRKRE